METLRRVQANEGILLSLPTMAQELWALCGGSWTAQNTFSQNTWEPAKNTQNFNCTFIYRSKKKKAVKKS